ncbi:MAG: hypothetical protein ACP5XB_31825 [Isosphaeraceae bacterium]
MIDDGDLRADDRGGPGETPVTFALWVVLLGLLIGLLTVFDWR